jgi:hypothetical protein
MVATSFPRRRESRRNNWRPVLTLPGFRVAAYGLARNDEAKGL